MAIKWTRKNGKYVARVGSYLLTITGAGRKWFCSVYDGTKEWPAMFSARSLRQLKANLDREYDHEPRKVYNNGGQSPVVFRHRRTRLHGRHGGNHGTF